MNIYSAESHVKKLLDYVTDLADTRPHMYAKSKYRLQDLADTCSVIVDLISEILQDRLLEEDESEFDNHTDSSVKNALESMQTHITQLNDFTTNKPKSAMSNNSVVESYYTCLQKVRNNVDSYEIGYVQVKRCIDILLRWLDVRFIKYNTEVFRFNAKRIKLWVRDFVIMYCYSITTNTDNAYYQDVMTWLDAINESSTYAVPYDIYRFDKSPSAEYMTLDAAVMWDILYDTGLDAICTDDRSDAYYPTSDSIYNLCVTLNPDILNTYKYYAEYPDIINRLNWTRG